MVEYSPETKAERLRKDFNRFQKQELKIREINVGRWSNYPRKNVDTVEMSEEYRGNYWGYMCNRRSTRRVPAKLSRERVYPEFDWVIVTKEALNRVPENDCGTVQKRGISIDIAGTFPFGIDPDLGRKFGQRYSMMSDKNNTAASANWWNGGTTEQNYQSTTSQSYGDDMEIFQARNLPNTASLVFYSVGLKPLFNLEIQLQTRGSIGRRWQCLQPTQKDRRHPQGRRSCTAPGKVHSILRREIMISSTTLGKRPGGKLK